MIEAFDYFFVQTARAFWANPWQTKLLTLALASPGLVIGGYLCWRGVQLMRIGGAGMWQSVRRIRRILAERRAR